MSSIADRLRELRGATSQAEMARHLGMKQPQWARYENGGAVPGADILERICRTHACSADWLLGLRDSQRSGSVIASGKNSVAIGHGSSVSLGDSPSCAKCPYKKKLKKLEALLKQ